MVDVSLTGLNLARGAYSYSCANIGYVAAINGCGHMKQNQRDFPFKLRIDKSYIKSEFLCKKLQR